MRRTSIVSLTVVALSVCAVGRPAQAMYGDIQVMAVAEPDNPKAPVSVLQAEPLNVWVPAENVVATWESLTAMSKLYNPAAQRAGAITERSLSLAARVDVLDVNGLIGFDSTERGTLVLDEKPRVFYSQAVPERYCRFYWPLRYIKKMPTPGQWVSELQPYNIKVDMPIDPNRPYPLMLSRVEWSMYALVNTGAKTVDVPFSLAADWLTLTPGLEIKVEQATAESGKYQYRLATRYSRSKVLWGATGGAAIMIWTHEPTPEVIVTKLDILDAQGKSLQGGAGSSSSSGGSSSGGSGSGGSSGGGAAGPATRGSSDDGADADGSATRRSAGSGAGAGGTGTVSDSGDLITITAEPAGDLMTGTTSGMGTYTGGGMATTFRFTLALKPLQQQLRFILENVPVPSL